MNASFEPLNVINWRRALKLICLEKVEVLEETSQEVRSQRCSLKIPAVVRLVRFIGLGKREVKFSRANIYARDRYRCQYCSVKLAPRDATCDHVLPRSRGGGTGWNNIVTCCRPCNRRKGDRTPEQSGLRLRKKPSKPSWLLGFYARFRFEDPPEAWQEYLYWNARHGG